jgi:hypothetical protein
MSKQRPTGITLLAIAFLVLGGLSLLWSLLQFGVGSVTGLTASLFGAGTIASAGASRAWAGLIGGAGAIFNLIVAFGLFTLRPWAWVLALIAIGINVISGVVGLFSGGLLALCCGLVGLAIPAGILYYLFRPEVKKAFGRV